MVIAGLTAPEFPSPEPLGRSLDIIIPETLRERHWQGFRARLQAWRQPRFPSLLKRHQNSRSRVAVSFVVNFEEGAEYSIADGDGENEAVYRD